MRAIRGSAAIAALAVASCVSYSGGAYALDPARLATEPGWIVALPPHPLQQPGPRDCGAAVLAMVAARWKVTLSVDGAIAALAVPTSEGVQLGDLRSVARAHGLTSFAVAGDRATLVHELRSGRPVIVGLLLPYGAGHAMSHYELVVAMRATEDEFVTIDPAGGWRARSWTALDTEWAPAGRPALVVLGRASQLGCARLLRTLVAAATGTLERTVERGDDGTVDHPAERRGRDPEQAAANEPAG